MLGFMYYLQLLGYVIVRQGMDQAMFLTKHYAVPVAWRRITIDYLVTSLARTRAHQERNWLKNIIKSIQQYLKAQGFEVAA
ncbi:hypothetical protein ABR2090_1111 [Acinetobacter baumannii]|nr:hypothetical protein ABR2090_1111 [Acinetobacter baumannii]